MLGLVNTLSTLGTTATQPVDSQVELKASKEYLINTLCIAKMKVYSTDDSDIRYKLNFHEDKSPEFFLRVSQTNAAIVAISDVAATSNMILLRVYLNDYGENVMTFAEAALSTSSTTAKYFNIDDILWGEENAAGNKSMLLIAEGGWGIKKIFVDHELAKIMDLLVTGTTTTTTTSTTTD